MKTHKAFRVLVCAPQFSEAGRRKLFGIYRLLAEGYDWDMDLVRTESDITPDLIENAKHNGFDGIFMSYLSFPSVNAKIATSGLPTVITDMTNPLILRRNANAIFIYQDTNTLIKEAVAHLRTLGNRSSFGYVPARINFPWSNTRGRAFLREMKKINEDSYIFNGDGSDRSFLEEWLHKLPKPTAILAALDDRANDVLSICRASGMRVPDDVAVLGIGNDESLCTSTHPQLSSIDLKFEDLGYRAARELQALMMRGTMKRRQEITLKLADVVTRDSTSIERTASGLVQKAITFINAHAVNGIGLPDVVTHMNVSRRLATLRFKEITGTTILDAILTRRIDKVKKLLVSTQLPIKIIALRCGYSDSNYLKNQFKKRIGMSMREFRNYHAGNNNRN